MTYTRANVYEHGGDFSNPTILWYARGVAVLKARRLASLTSWRFYAGIHGFNQARWEKFGYLSPSDQMPSDKDVALYWDQCQHGSWYFFPWHRGYVYAFESVVRDAIVGLGGPDDWALPYWNYFAPDEFRLPPAFATRDWPDGTGDNPLFVEQRWGPKNNGDVYVPLDRVNLEALKETHFTGVPGAPAFGGIDTGFEHAGKYHGLLESQPHDQVHVLVGGAQPGHPLVGGLMSSPPTAGLDPIFWLHHANIDRLWETWLLRPDSLGNPTAAKWREGPLSVKEHPFVMPMPHGRVWSYTPEMVADLSSLDYTYDSFAPELAVPEGAQRTERLRGAPAATEGGATMESPEPNVELVGANDRALRIAGSGGVSASVRLDPPAARRMTEGLRAAAAEEGAAASEPDRVFLNLENVRSVVDAVMLDVYVNVPAGANPEDHPDRRAGSIALFGAAQATDADGEHGGSGLSFAMEITDIVQGLHLENAADANALEVRVVPFNDVPDEAQVSIGRVSVYRKGR